jgi:hypothetical protein
MIFKLPYKMQETNSRLSNPYIKMSIPFEIKMTIKLKGWSYVT